MQGAKKKILLIEDEPHIMKLEAVILKEYDVSTAYVGSEGIEKARDERPDLIILDLMMPKIDGFEVLETLKGSDNTEIARITKGIPVLIVSSASQAIDMNRAFSLGACDYITKPFEPKDLLKKVREILSDSRNAPLRKKRRSGRRKASSSKK